MDNKIDFKDYIKATPSIDCDEENIIKKAKEIWSVSNDKLDYIERVYEFVRDEIPHSWDIGADVVSKKASEVLKNKTGICWTKSCLLAALLRAMDIPAGISYQKLTRADEDDSEGHIIHALNTVYIDSIGRWIRLDARGNKENVHAKFSIDEEVLAFNVREELGEKDYHSNTCDLDERLKEVLFSCEAVQDIHTDFDM